MYNVVFIYVYSLTVCIEYFKLFKVRYFWDNFYFTF